MQGALLSLKSPPPLPRKVIFRSSKKNARRAKKNVAKMLENSVLDLAVSIFCPIFVVQNERETPPTF